MNEPELLNTLSRTGIAMDAQSAAWRDAATLLSAFDAIARRGAIALVKIDGPRPGPDIYTVLLSGGPLGERYFRRDGAELRPLLMEAIAFYVANASLAGEAG